MRVGGPECKGTVTVGQCKAAFAYEQFDKFCECMEVPAGEEGFEITCKMWGDFYSDVSMATFNDNQFIQLVENTWGVGEPADATVTRAQVE